MAMRMLLGLCGCMLGLCSTAGAQETEDPEILPQDIEVSEGESNDNDESQTEYKSGTDEDLDSKEASS